MATARVLYIIYLAMCRPCRDAMFLASITEDRNTDMTSEKYKLLQRCSKQLANSLLASLIFSLSVLPSSVAIF